MSWKKGRKTFVDVVDIVGRESDMEMLRRKATLLPQLFTCRPDDYYPINCCSNSTSDASGEYMVGVRRGVANAIELFWCEIPQFLLGNKSDMEQFGVKRGISNALDNAQSCSREVINNGTNKRQNPAVFLESGRHRGWSAKISGQEPTDFVIFEEIGMASGLRA
jgi:hypothetical protein